MMNIEYIDKAVISTIEIEDYFPLVVSFHASPDLVKHYRIYCEDTDMIEFEADHETGINLRMKLVLCNHVGYSDRAVSTPNNIIGELAFSGADLFDPGSAELITDTFLLDVCNDGVELTLGRKEPRTYVRSGSVTFGLDDSNVVTRIIVADMTPDELSHLSDEIENE